MGGPCQVNGKSIGPCSDNFAISQKPFHLPPLSADMKKINDETDTGAIFCSTPFYSAEHAYQWLKMANKSDQAKIVAMKPKPNESGWDFGMRCWNAGQRGERRKSFQSEGGGSVKKDLRVRAMYWANRAKIYDNDSGESTSGSENQSAPESDNFRQDLLNSGSSSAVITHRGSGPFWDDWNPVLLMLIREELRTKDADCAKIKEWREMMGLPN